MIESARFTNVNGSYIDFNTNDIPFNSFTTDIDTRFTEKARSQKHGVYPADTYLGSRVFHVEGAIMANTSAEYWEKRMEMLNALMPRPQFNKKVAGTLDLLLTGFSEHLTIDCTLDGWPELPLEGLSPSVGRFQIHWKSFDPRLYGPSQLTDIAYSANWQNIGGRSYNKTYNKSWTTSSSGPGQAIISNSGNIETFPQIAFYGPITNPRAVMSRSDGVISTFTLNPLVLSDPADYVVIDMEKHLVTRSNGANLYPLAIGSDWFAFDPAPIQNVITLSGDTLSVGAHLSVSWRNAYMI